MTYSKEIEALLESIYSVRMLVFMESEPQSNRYKQVLLNQEQFKLISLNLGRKVKLPDQEGVEFCLPLSDKEYTLPDLPDIFDEKK